MLKGCSGLLLMNQLPWRCRFKLTPRGELKADSCENFGMLGWLSNGESPDSVCCLGCRAVSQACFLLESDSRTVGKRMRQLPALPSWTVSSRYPCKVTPWSPSVVLETSLRQSGQLHGGNRRLTSVFPDESLCDGHFLHHPRAQISHPEEGNFCPQAPCSLLPAKLMSHASLPIFRSFFFKAALGTRLPHPAPTDIICVWPGVRCSVTRPWGLRLLHGPPPPLPQGVPQPTSAAMTVTLPRSVRAGQERLSRNQAKVTRSEGSASIQKVCTGSCQLWSQALFLSIQSNPTLDILLCPSS